MKDSGRISAKQAKARAESEWERYRVVQDRFYTSDFDRFLQLETLAIEKKDSDEQ